MGRFLLQYVLPLLLPFLVYAAYVLLAHRQLPDWLGLDARHWAMLGGAGVLLLAISLITWSLTSGSPPDEAYVPPHLEHGRIVPGRTVAE
jgi:hypothetical protein